MDLKSVLMCLSFLSWIRTTEIVGDYTDFSNGTCHPHLHILVRADWGYYSGKRYLLQE